MPDPIVEAAVWYANHGMPVLPCLPLGKAPIGDLVEHGCLDATTDETTIRAWWDEFPLANVGLATGLPSYDVLDIDAKNDGIANSYKIAKAGLAPGWFWWVNTPSGGWHLYYAGTSQPNGSLRRHGIDFRGKGGYVVAPPSQLETGRYAWRRRRPQTGATVNWSRIRDYFAPPPSKRLLGDHEKGNFTGLLTYMEQMPEGGRNSTLYSIARQILDEDGGDADLDALADAAATAGLRRDEIERTIESAKRGAR